MVSLNPTIGRKQAFSPFHQTLTVIYLRLLDGTNPASNVGKNGDPDKMDPKINIYKILAVIIKTIRI